jgi:hypothetical protein
LLVRKKQKLSVRNFPSNSTSRPTTVISEFGSLSLKEGLLAPPNVPRAAATPELQFTGTGKKLGEKLRKKLQAQEKAPARNVVCMDTNCHIVSHCCICQTCKASHAQAKNDTLGEPIEKTRCAFMRCDSEVLQSFPHLDLNRSFLLF